MLIPRLSLKPFLFVASLFFANGLATAAPNYPDTCRQAGGDDVCRPPTVATVRFSYVAMDLGNGTIRQPFDGFETESAARTHYALSYFGPSNSCGSGTWNAREKSIDGPYSESTYYDVKVNSGDTCLPNISHGVRMYATRPISCPARFELKELGGGTYYCHGKDLIDKEKDQGKPKKCAGNPCNVASGNKYQAETDFVVPAVGGLRFDRYYNSNSGRWTNTYSRSVSYSDFENGIYSAKVYRQDGRVLQFYRIMNNPTAGRDVDERLEPIIAAGQIIGWKFFALDDSVEVYDQSGRLTSITDRAGWVQTLAYDIGGLKTVTDAYGRKISFTYSNLGMTVTDPALNAFQYKYNIAGKLETVTYPGGKSRKYLYNEPGNTAGANLPNALTGLIDEKGVRYATWTYDPTGRAISSEHAGGAERVDLEYETDSDGNPFSTTVKDAAGASRTEHFQVLNGGVLPTGRSGDCTTCGADASISDYDSSGRVREHKDQNGNSTAFTYYADRNLEETRDQSGRLTTTYWHAKFRLPVLIVEPKRSTKFTYDSATGLLSEKEVTDLVYLSKQIWKYTYVGRLLKTVDGPRTDVSDVTTYDYDTKGNLASVKNALGQLTKFTAYDLNGRLLEMLDPSGLVTTFRYNGRGALKSVTRGTEITLYDYDDAGLLKQVTMPTLAVFKYTYDDAHRLTDIETESGERTHFVLNLLGQREREEVYNSTGGLVQLKSATFDLGGELHEAIDAYNKRTTLTYDGNGNLYTIEDPLARVTTLHPDEFNRVAEVTLADGVSKIVTEYDANDEVAAVTSPSELRVEYTLDGLGNRRKTKTSDIDPISEENAFDSAGNVSTNIEFRGITTTRKYDALNRLKTIAAPEAVQISLSYDQGTYGVGHMTGASDESGTTTFTYSQSGYLSKYARTVGALTITTGYKVDNAGRLEEITYPSGRVLKHGYLNGKLIGLSFGGIQVLSGIGYHPFGEPNKWTWGNGKAYARHFDLNGALETFDQASSAKTVRRDDAGRIIGLDDSTAQALNQTFVYDEFDRLTEYRTGPTAILERKFKYDVEGNRRSVTVGGKEYPYTYAEASNYLIAVSGPVAKQWGMVDPYGKAVTDGKNVFKIDPYRRTSGVTNASTTVTYLRDYASRRVTKKFANGTTIHYVFDQSDQLIAELDGAGVTMVEYIWMNNTPVAIYQQGAFYYIYADHLNTPRAVTDTSNAVRWTWHSEPFGSTAPNTSPAGKGPFVLNLRFPGQYYDAESGLHYNYHRDYDPQVGRYIQSDPIGLNGGLNTYVYVKDNPINRQDPSGLVDIYVGGAKDGSTKIVSSWVDKNATGAKYFEWTQGAEISEFISKVSPNEPINLFGHSYGGDTAAWAAIRAAGRITSLTTLDPVSRFQPDFKKLRCSVGTWRNVNAVPIKSDRTDTVAWLGGKWGTGPKGYATSFAEANVNHGDFGGLMRSIDETSSDECACSAKK